LYETEPGVRVLVESQRPPGPAATHVILVHGLEGSSGSSYMMSFAAAALSARFAVHRFNLRSCGGTESVSRTGYNAGMTCDLLAFLRRFDGTPPYLVGFSLGGNVVLKLAGELGESARGLIAGVCGISTPIDLSASTRRLEQPRNRLYERRFVWRLKRRTQRLVSDPAMLAALSAIRTVREFDNRITAPSFGFRDAEHYYTSQSASRVLPNIRVPYLLVQAKDDPVVPYGMFEGVPGVLATEHGGHVAFLARRRPRFWANAAVIEWIESQSTS
jgi:predicted alpha/beta-fold hydrolase